MKTIKNDVETVLEIEKSKFITILKYINNIADVKKEIKMAMSKYPKATHYCYAYIINSDKKCSDDNEPSGTAGLPILNVLDNNNLNHVIAIVVRYFGGIKLGAGGLVRAYTKSVTTALDKNNFCNLLPGYIIEIDYEYNNSKIIDYLLKDYKIIDKKFTDIITTKIEIDYESWNKIKDELFKICFNIKINDKLYIKK